MDKQISVLGINGSPFVDGWAARLLQENLTAAEQCGASVSCIHLPLSIPLCDGRREEHLPLHERIARLPTGGNLPIIVLAVLQADALILSSPTHSFNMSDTMKILGDWLMVTTDFPDHPLKGKVAGFMSVCESDGGMLADMLMWAIFSQLGCIAAPFPYYYSKSGEGASQAAPGSEAAWQKEDIGLLGRNVARLAKCIPKGIDWAR